MKSIVTALILLSAGLLIAETGGTRYAAVESLEVVGADEIPRAVIFSGANIKKTGGMLMVDLNSLESVISQSPLIEKYEISRRDKRLFVRLKRSGSLFTAALTTGRGTLFIETGDNLEIRVKGYPVSGNLPIIYIEETDYVNGVFSKRIEDTAETLRTVKKNEPGLFNEISELRFEDGYLVLRARGRQTEFILKNSYTDFMRFKYTLGYADSSPMVFAKADIRKNPVLLR